MRILFDPGVYDMRNKGNVALLQAAVDRIGHMWPDATLEVLTVSPHLLRFYCPGARPVYPEAPGGKLTDNRRFQQMHSLIPHWVWRTMFELREASWRRTGSGVRPGPVHPPAEQAANETGQQLLSPNTGGDIVTCADLLVATGAQYMSDACRDDALRVLDRFETATRQGIPTVMVGQGFGPIKDPSLVARSKAVLPLVDLIFVRERTASPQLLTALGVDPAHILLTGDDAIEMAYRSRTTKMGKAIGVGLRVAGYTEVDERHVRALRSAIQQAALKYGAALVSIPISHSAHELDDVVLGQVLAGYHPVHSDWRRFNSPLEIIRQVSHCRVVVAGTFHALVFALAQGIPAVGLARSEMYMDKFVGLVDLFGNGLQIVRLDDSDLACALTEAISRVWDSAEQVRVSLLDRAQAQIEMGRAAYQCIYNLAAKK